MNRTCVYYCEGEDDQKLIDALKVAPGKILPGKSKKLNVVQSLIPKSILLGLTAWSICVIIQTDYAVNILKNKNIL